MNAEWQNINDSPHPPWEPDDPFIFQDSVNVLILDDKRIYLGYARRYINDNEDKNIYWYIAGRDSYRLYNVTHWMLLPQLP